MQNNYCIIMAGGVGSRFWPFSKSDYPKQFIDFFGTGRSLLQITFDRFKDIVPTENIYIVSNTTYKDLIIEQLPKLNSEQILLEPMRRNTAPCIAYAVYKIKAKCNNANIIVVPSDHLITNETEYIRVLKEGLNFIKQNHNSLLTLGMKPTRPETGYGYIQITDGDTSLRKVKTFIEKPNREMAEIFLNSGEFYWNSGMFLWHTNAITKAFETHLPEIASAFEGGKDFYNTPKEQEYIDHIYPTCKNISIDYGIMEKSNNVYVMMADFGWSDLGTWQSLYDIGYKDEKNNVSYKCLKKIYDASNNLIVMPEGNLAVIDGLQGYLIAQHNNVLLICKKDEEYKIRQFVADVEIMPDGKKFI
ncbi:MAG: mannose-1-phosphate guanylyltransferase [Porphyromonadaceae bacterium]|nr:mannose-1-phosphate guanylyltransferase [Porphyromonadaceae bacterium]